MTSPQHRNLKTKLAINICQRTHKNRVRSCLKSTLPHLPNSKHFPLREGLLLQGYRGKRGDGRAPLTWEHTNMGTVWDLWGKAGGSEFHWESRKAPMASCLSLPLPHSHDCGWAMAAQTAQIATKAPKSHLKASQGFPLTSWKASASSPHPGPGWSQTGHLAAGQKEHHVKPANSHRTSILWPP